MGAPWRFLAVHTRGPARQGAQAVFEEHESDSRFVRLTGCPDCRGEPMTVTPVPPGYSARLLVEHDETCPAIRAELRKYGNGSQP